ncbi:GATA transcription factor 21 [Heracleum sosnowskyi]|uniref:GATA transcription factor 21 n=1 Tax=Heracleum sosnowskyi TaxID=360622 RepID=A0AAD8I363_9APIA|nr:GATA transcription factor 21 [Heracleum sosnowskyi]
MTTSTYQNYSSQYSSNLQEHVLFSSPNVYHDAETNHSSSPSLTTRDFFSSITDLNQEYSGSYYHKELEQPEIQLDQVNDDFASNGGSCDQVENESSDNGLKFSIWKKEDHTSAYTNAQKSSSTKYQVKWISSEMRLMHKMNNTDPTDVNAPRMISSSSLKLEDQKQPSSDHMETDNTSNTTSSNTMISNINHPIRVCSDCNTTKTPLWRSGPQGPKSLCNACGIRQRKARRAMAAAAAENGISTRTDTKVLIKKTKTPQKDKTKKSSILKGSSSVVSKFKNQGKVAATSSNQDKKKLCLEDFFLSLSKNLAFYTVFPQDEKEAAILLMALSFGHAHG